VRAIRLESRGRIGVGRAAVEAERVPRARADPRHSAGVVSAGFFLQWDSLVADLHLHPIRAGRPHAEMHAPILIELGPDWQTPPLGWRALTLSHGWSRAQLPYQTARTEASAQPCACGLRRNSPEVWGLLRECHHVVVATV
jgi:hypothetical protein